MKPRNSAPRRRAACGDLTLGPEDKQVRDWFRTALRSRRTRGALDALARMFALRRPRHDKTAGGLGSISNRSPPAASSTACSARWPHSRCATLKRCGIR